MIFIPEKKLLSAEYNNEPLESSQPPQQHVCFYLLTGLTFLALVSMLLSLFNGSTSISAANVWQTLLGQNTPLLHEIIFELRLPHMLSAFTAGGLLALAGALMQVLLRNPLADPYVLGISSGAALATLLCMLIGVSGYWLIGGAWLGSFATIFCVLALANLKNTWIPQRLLLTGIALACGFSALISFILLTSPEKTLRSMLFWLTGDLSFAHFPAAEFILLFLGLLISLSFSRELNILSRGEREAKTLGINTQHLHWKLYLLSSLLTAAAVTLAGCIGFAGLIVPHVFRLLGGHDYRFLLPGCVLLGGSLVTLADTLARTLIAPQQLPVGMVMTLLGVPVFLVLLQKNSS